MGKNRLTKTTLEELAKKFRSTKVETEAVKAVAEKPAKVVARPKAQNTFNRKTVAEMEAILEKNQGQTPGRKAQVAK